MRSETTIPKDRRVGRPAAPASCRDGYCQRAKFAGPGDAKLILPGLALGREPEDGGGVGTGEGVRKTV